MKMAESCSETGRKHCGKKEKLLIMSNFSFSHSVFKRLVLQTHKNQGLFGKGLKDHGPDTTPHFESTKWNLHLKTTCCERPLVTSLGWFLNSGNTTKLDKILLMVQVVKFPNGSCCLQNQNLDLENQ